MSLLDTASAPAKRRKSKSKSKSISRAEAERRHGNYPQAITECAPNRESQQLGGDQRARDAEQPGNIGRRVADHSPLRMQESRYSRS
jgi:hypothetical protein